MTGHKHIITFPLGFWESFIPFLVVPLQSRGYFLYFIIFAVFFYFLRKMTNHPATGLTSLLAAILMAKCVFMDLFTLIS